MTHLADHSVIPQNPLDDVARTTDSTFSRLLRFALANLRRRPERALLSVLGIGLAIAAVVVVRTIAAGHQDAGVAAVARAVDGAPYWVVPAGGVGYDSGALAAAGHLPPITVPPGWTFHAAPEGWATITTDATPDEVAAATGLRVVSDPAIAPAPGEGGLVYATEEQGGRGSFVGFDQKYAALLGGQVESSVLGLIGQAGLVLGFVIAVTGFMASVQERRREFGIMSSVGLSDEVLYFFMVESLLVFAAAYLFGVLAGGAVVAVLLPAFFGLAAWLTAAGLVAMYLPALGIVAALVPVHRLLQQRPVALLVEHA
ncbi:ABC transporter permease [Nonomuraea turcica]|uniref:ABC transporter permease n=1 Tax=Nonomuraea sp. G32 TaxID=3067274 RepID=UPI00273C63AE|nr:ABC transporter permease [Nonomuraea sp. G32]MDP4503423.1 ABC transporter permease [Nonomuraea sp. G32]